MKASTPVSWRSVYLIGYASACCIFLCTDRFFSSNSMKGMHMTILYFRTQHPFDHQAFNWYQNQIQRTITSPRLRKRYMTMSWIALYTVLFNSSTVWWLEFFFCLGGCFLLIIIKSSFKMYLIEKKQTTGYMEVVIKEGHMTWRF